MGYIIGLAFRVYRRNGKEKGNSYNGLYMFRV